jgi:MFS transporter, FHS family, glucose/mannose:H+ symporter
MPTPETLRAESSAKALTLAGYASFVPIGITTVLLGPMLPTLAARWSLNDAQAGSLFTLQYVAATLTVGLSGWLIGRRGYRFAINAGLVLETIGMVLLVAGPKVSGMAGIAAYGAGLGFIVPAANLLVAEVNPSRRSAALNLLNFCWSTGAVSCPFLVAAAARSLRVPLFLELVAGFSLLVAIGIAAMPSSIVEPAVLPSKGSNRSDWRRGPLFILGLLFFIYVGTETAFGGWVAKYSKTLGSLSATMAVMTPSFFYGSIMAGRWLAPQLLRIIDDVRLAQAGLLIACTGMVGLVLSHALPGVVLSACLAGLGLSAVYPITISLMSREFGPAAARIGSVMFMLANLGGGLIPLLVGVCSDQFGTLKAGLTVPLMGSAAMYFLYLRNWKSEAAEQPA